MPSRRSRVRDPSSLDEESSNEVGFRIRSARSWTALGCSGSARSARSTWPGRCPRLSIEGRCRPASAQSAESGIPPGRKANARFTRERRSESSCLLVVKLQASSGTRSWRGARPRPPGRVVPCFASRLRRRQPNPAVADSHWRNSERPNRTPSTRRALVFERPADRAGLPSGDGVSCPSLLVRWVHASAASWAFSS